MNPCACVVCKEPSNSLHKFRGNFLSEVVAGNMNGAANVGDFFRHKCDGFRVQEEIACGEVNKLAADLTLQISIELYGLRSILANTNFDASVGAEKLLGYVEKNCRSFGGNCGVAD